MGSKISGRMYETVWGSFRCAYRQGDEPPNPPCQGGQNESPPDKGVGGLNCPFDLEKDGSQAGTSLGSSRTSFSQYSDPLPRIKSGAGSSPLPPFDKLRDQRERG